MIIVHKIGDFLFDLFPSTKNATNRIEALTQSIKDFYTYNAFVPKVSIQNDLVTIEIDTQAIISQDADYRKVISLCEKGKYSEAKPILYNLIQKNPTNSEYHRIYGQVLSDEGNFDEAINYLIDALRWNPKNGYALIMMGNIYAREKDDLETAKRYYDEAISINPKDNIAINNLGTNLLQLGKLEKGLEYLEKAYELNPKYPNSSYGIALANEKLGNPLVAFDFCVIALKNCRNNDQTILNHTLSLLITVSEEWIRTDSGKKVFNEYKSYLEKLAQKSIKEEKDVNIPTIAKLEVAENYNRDYHVIKYKQSVRGIEHLMMHELVHLQFIIDARKEKTNKLFVTNGQLKAKFIKEHESDFKKIVNRGIGEDALRKYSNALFEGINSQIYNAPIDLFIEDYLNTNYHELRPYQFISLYNLLIDYSKSVNDKQAKELSPKDVAYANKVLNIVNALHFKDLFGLDLIAKFNPTPNEIREANRLYAEYNEYKKDKEPSEEYELVQHWAEDLKMSKYFELIDENSYRTKSDLDSILSNIENDPFDVDSDKEFKQSETDKFLKSQSEIGLNMAVVMFMVDALQFFHNKSKEKIKQTALEIAMLGTQGINPDGSKKYKLANVPNKEFSGYHLLAYYYVTWALAIPEMLQSLNLPYDKEYVMAQQMFKK